MAKPQVLLLGDIKYSQTEWEQLSDVAELLTLSSKDRTEFFQDLKGKYSNITAIFRTFQSAQVTGLLDEEFANALPSSIKAVCHNGAGYDQIKVEFFSKRGIQVSNTPGAVDAATADTNIYLILGALRNFNKGANDLRKGHFVSQVPMGHDPEHKVLGILGMGGIGRAVRDRAESFGMKVVYYSRNRLEPQLEKNSTYVTFDELLAQSDVISLNLPLNAHTRHSINSETIAKMKDGVVIVNTARGAVIDEDALVKALESGKVSSVGLDVFEHEPEIHPKLLDNENVLLLPHMGTHTFESRKKMEMVVINNIRSLLTTGNVITLVPEQTGLF